MSSPVEIGLSLGSNLGDKTANIRAAAALLVQYEDTDLAGKSSLYETEPVDVRSEFQHLKFLNSVMIVSSTASAETWLKRIGDVETELGRVRDDDDKNIPRPVDVDIIFYGDQLIGSGGLVVPHPRWAERRFVVQPLADLQPERILPGMELSVGDILKHLPGEEGLIRLETEW
jgi:2-amino-4-hydroxy-6-hydroxymethyldihydropteridine diphosphokinase